MRPAPLVLSAAVVAFVLGGAISIAAFYVARYGPSGDSWSFRGNGALAVYPALPAALAGGWTALALHARHGRRWLALGLGAGAVGLALALLAASILPVFGMTADTVATPVLTIALLLWMIVAPALGARRPAGALPAPIRWHVVAGAVWFVAAVAGLVVVGFIVPAGS